MPVDLPSSIASHDDLLAVSFVLPTHGYILLGSSTSASASNRRMSEWSEPLLEEVMAMPDRMVLEHGKGLVAEPRVEFRRLKTERGEPRARAPAPDRIALRRGQELASVPAASERLGDPKDLHEEPPAPELAETAAKHLR